MRVCSVRESGAGAMSHVPLWSLWEEIKFASSWAKTATTFSAHTSQKLDSMKVKEFLDRINHPNPNPALALLLELQDFFKDPSGGIEGTVHSRILNSLQAAIESLQSDGPSQVYDPANSKAAAPAPAPAPAPVPAPAPAVGGTLAEAKRSLMPPPSAKGVVKINFPSTNGVVKIKFPPTTDPTPCSTTSEKTPSLNAGAVIPKKVIKKPTIVKPAEGKEAPPPPSVAKAVTPKAGDLPTKVKGGGAGSTAVPAAQGTKRKAETAPTIPKKIVKGGTGSKLPPLPPPVTYVSDEEQEF